MGEVCPVISYAWTLCFCCRFAENGDGHRDAKRCQLTAMRGRAILGLMACGKEVPAWLRRS